MSGGLAEVRIVFVVGWAVLGGAERQVLLLVRHLLREGARVEVVALTDEDGRFRREIEAEGVPWHAVPLHWDGGRSAKVRKLARLALALRGRQPDVLVSYTTRPNVVTGLVWRLTGARLWVWNQTDLGRSKKFSPRLVTHAARAAPLFVASSQAAADFLEEKLGADRERVRMVRTTVELREAVETRETWRKRLGVDDDTVVVTMLGHFHEGKDHATLLGAWQMVSDETDGRVLLVLAGRDAGGEAYAKAIAYDLELGRSVRFLGDVEDVAGLLEATDIGMLSSRQESSPNAVLECMAAGLPVATTDAPGITEVLGEHQRPFTAPPGDADGLARALLRLVADPSLRMELGRENRQLTLARAERPSAPAIARLIADALAD